MTHRSRVWLALSILSALSAPVGAQVVAPRDTLIVPTDTVRRMTPLNAMWRSMLVPGWGQAATGRPVTGALLAAWEGVTIYMWQKAEHELDYLEETGSDRVNAKKRESEDWLVLLVFNHLFAGAEAFVSGHLQDFPEELKLVVTPRRIGISLSLP